MVCFVLLLGNIQLFIFCLLSFLDGNEKHRRKACIAPVSGDVSFIQDKPVNFQHVMSRCLNPPIAGNGVKDGSPFCAEHAYLEEWLVEAEVERLTEQRGREDDDIIEYEIIPDIFEDEQQYFSVSDNDNDDEDYDNQRENRRPPAPIPPRRAYDFDFEEPEHRLTTAPRCPPNVSDGEEDIECSPRKRRRRATNFPTRETEVFKRITELDIEVEEYDENNCKKKERIKLYQTTTGGLLVFSLHCGQIVGIFDLMSHEGLEQVIGYMYVLFERHMDKLRYVVYDRACDLETSLQRRATKGCQVSQALLTQVKGFCVDTFHGLKHRYSKCRLVNGVAGIHHKDHTRFNGVISNSSKQEQSNRVINHHKVMSRCVRIDKARFFLLSLVVDRNRMRPNDRH